MTIILNGEQHALPHQQTVRQLLLQRGYSEGLAVAVNGIFVPRSTYEDQIIKEGDSIEILSPMQGG